MYFYVSFKKAHNFSSILYAKVSAGQGVVDNIYLINAQHPLF